MADLPEVFALGDRMMLGPRPAKELAGVIRLVKRLSPYPLATRMLDLAEILERFAAEESADDVNAALPPLPNSVALLTTMIDPINVTEAARLLGCTPGNVRQKLRRGTLAGQLISGTWWIERADV